MDYRKLNEITVKNKYPLPIIQELLDLLADTIYFSLMDVDTGYNNVLMDKKSRKLAAFVTNLGMYEPLVMFFGLTNSPATSWYSPKQWRNTLKWYGRFYRSYKTMICTYNC